MMQEFLNLLKETSAKKNKSNPIYPKDLGWIEKKLTKAELDYVWYCIDNSTKVNTKPKLAGNISASYDLHDEKDLFWRTVVHPLVKDYEESFTTRAGYNVPVEGNASLNPFMNIWWVNYQNQTEFNPTHNHTGVYSFVIWMKIPTKFEEQRQLPIANDSNSSTISNFVFTYTNILGGITSHAYPMSPEIEGTMVLFPAALSHQVYPFYNCDGTRISVSGNVSLK
tara:strand:- start:167 stop:838 length:672 start_codon:yes stop_codon:yes gene_type:complete